MVISRAHWDELIAHTRDEEPLECCGYGRVVDGRLADLVRGDNEMKSQYGFRLDSKSLLEAWKIEDEDGDQVAIYHSHPRSEPRPSQQDINILGAPGWLFLIVGLVPEPTVRAWRIDDGRVEEEDVVVE